MDRTSAALAERDPGEHRADAARLGFRDARLAVEAMLHLLEDRIGDDDAGVVPAGHALLIAVELATAVDTRFGDVAAVGHVVDEPADLGGGPDLAVGGRDLGFKVQPAGDVAVGEAVHQFGDDGQDRLGGL